MPVTFNCPCFKWETGSFLCTSFFVLTIISGKNRALEESSIVSRRGRALFRNGSRTPWNYFHGQTRASQNPLSELQEPEHFPHRAAEGWRFAVSGKTLHEEEFAHNTGTQFGIHHYCDWDPRFLQCCSSESIQWLFFIIFLISQPDNLAQKLPNLIELWVCALNECFHGGLLCSFNLYCCLVHLLFQIFKWESVLWMIIRYFFSTSFKVFALKQHCHYSWRYSVLILNITMWP